MVGGRRRTAFDNNSRRLWRDHLHPKNRLCVLPDGRIAGFTGDIVPYPVSSEDLSRAEVAVGASIPRPEEGPIAVR